MHKNFVTLEESWTRRWRKCPHNATQEIESFLFIACHDYSINIGISMRHSSLLFLHLCTRTIDHQRHNHQRHHHTNSWNIISNSQHVEIWGCQMVGFFGFFLYWYGDDTLAAASKVCNIINYANKSINLATWLGWLIVVSIWIFGCHDQGSVGRKCVYFTRPVTR